MVAYKKLLRKGEIQEAYRGLMAYFRDLRVHFIRATPQYPVSASIYYGYMDMTYFVLFPEQLKRQKLKISIFYDQCGSGGSSEVKPDDPCGLAELMGDLHALRGHLKVDRMDLLGHSWGGFLAIGYTARYPQQVRRLILVESAAPRLEDTLDLFENVFPQTVERQNAVDIAVELGDSQRFDLNPEIAKFKQPTLVISSRYDINVAPPWLTGSTKPFPIHVLKCLSAVGTSRSLKSRRHLPKLLMTFFSRVEGESSGISVLGAGNSIRGLISFLQSSAILLQSVCLGGENAKQSEDGRQVYGVCP